jgi:hypothetical protein
MPQSPFTNAIARAGLVYLNDRIQALEERYWNVPADRLFVITDIVVQNRAPGDLPVQSSQFTRFSFTSPAGTTVFFVVVGNETFSEHFTTGMPVSGSFQFMNVANSTAPFIELVITGVLRDL